MPDPRFPQHNLIARERATLALIVDFVQFTGGVWYGSRSKQAHAFAGSYAREHRDVVVRSVLLVMDNYGIDGVMSPRAVENAGNLALDSVGVDHDELARERERLRALERTGDVEDGHGITSSES